MKLTSCTGKCLYQFKTLDETRKNVYLLTLAMKAYEIHIKIKNIYCL